MPRLARFDCALFAGALLMIFAAGCGREASPTAPSAVSSSASVKPPAGETTSKRASETAVEAPFVVETGFDLLELDQFETFDAQPGTWTATPDGFTCTGKPRGYIYSRKPYQNFSLRLDYRFPRPETLKDDLKFKGNTGFLVYINGDHKLWPICLEVQGKYVQMAAIKENGGAQPVTVEEDDAARQRVRTPVGQWNAIEIHSKDGVLQVALNGTPVTRSQPDFLSEGLIGVQAEDHPFEVRRMRIRVE
jgi:hypothetical protein